MKNGGRPAGAVTAAMFPRNSQKASLAHLDIAGTAYSESTRSPSPRDRRESRRVRSSNSFAESPLTGITGTKRSTRLGPWPGRFCTRRLLSSERPSCLRERNPDSGQTETDSGLDSTKVKADTIRRPRFR